MGEFQNFCPVAWLACEKLRGEVKGKLCREMRLKWGQICCWEMRELAYFLTSYLTLCGDAWRLLWRPQTPCDKCLRLHQNGLWTPTRSMKCSLDVLIMGLFFSFERRRKKKKIDQKKVFCVFFSYIVLLNFVCGHMLENKSSASTKKQQQHLLCVHFRMQMWSFSGEAICACMFVCVRDFILLSSRPYRFFFFLQWVPWPLANRGLASGPRWQMKCAGSWGYVRTAHSLAVEDRASSVIAVE